MERCDLLVIGAGVVGLTAARAFARRHPGQRVVVLDKEPEVGRHASGRNSGVLHAGFYYDADSLKARFSRDGNRALADYCEEHALPLRRCGKLVVPRDAAELPALDALAARGANGVRLEAVSAEEAQRIEPRVRAHERALWSPDTAVVSPQAVCAQLARELGELGVTLRTSTPFRGRDGEAVLAGDDRIEAGAVLNCAGAFADRVAAGWGAGEAYQLVPFRGLYLLADPATASLACCVYPVPPSDMPFLGVHLTVTVEGTVKIGPTATPARWREDYGGLAGLRWRDVAEQLRIQPRLLRRNALFRRHAVSELSKRSAWVLVREASRLVDGLPALRSWKWGRPGIRAQLVERASGALVGDFVVERAERSLHVLNAVSPAFTCSLPFAEHLVDLLEAA
ncbi:MAG: L-2-hydroxyglutarate oxidase [Myxococcota bacterium]